MTEPLSRCPDRFELFVGLEESDPAMAEHLGCCPRCRELADAERSLTAPLARLRDPIAPTEVLAGALARIAELELAARRTRVQLWSAFAVSLAFAAGLCTLFWRPLMLDAALGAVRSLSQLRIAASALGRALGPSLWAASAPLVALETVALLGCAFVLHRALAPSAR